MIHFLSIIPLFIYNISDNDSCSLSYPLNILHYDPSPNREENRKKEKKNESKNKKQENNTKLKKEEKEIDK